MQEYSMSMDRKSQHYQNVSSSQLYLQIQCNAYQNVSMSFGGYQQIDPEFNIERQKT
jgi:hypothetical protein